MKILAPAKLNLFLKVVNKRKDGYHNIKTGVTFLNLYDEVLIETSRKKQNYINYFGPFAPKRKKFNNDIIKKLLRFIYFEEKKKFYLKIKIKKNIPFNSGLGGASADAAAILRALYKLKIISKKMDVKKMSLIGADIPMCLKSKDCIAEGIGEKINYKIKRKKNYFLLVKPNFSLSTKKIYSKFKLDKKNKLYSNDLINTVSKINPKIRTLLDDLSFTKKNNLSNMSGSGSCCYARFNKLKDVKIAMKEITKKYPNYWVFIAKNIS